MNQPLIVKATGLEAGADGGLSVVPDPEPNDDWYELWERYWRNPTTRSTCWRHGTYARHDGRRLVFKDTNVDNFKECLQGVVQDGIRQANVQLLELEDKRREERAAAAEADRGRLEALEQEKAKARDVKFDS
jgi:hypothetical protein